MKIKHKKIQIIEISVDELFCWQDKLYLLENSPEKAWDLFNDFLNECKNQLELSDEIINESYEKSMNNISEEELFEDNVNVEDSLQFRPRLNF